VTARWTRRWPLVPPALALMTLVVIMAGIGGAVRAAVVLTFITVAPGLAVFRRLGLPLEPALCATVVVATSWAIGAALALVQLYAQVWSIEVALITLGVFVVALSLPDVMPTRALIRRATGRVMKGRVNAP